MRPVSVPPGPGQESVWDYPRPPRLEPVPERLRVAFGGAVIAETRAGYRVLETSHPPTYYLPPGAVVPGILRRAGGGSLCEWKGAAAYFDVVAGARSAPRAAWTYPEADGDYAPIRGYVAFYPAPMDGCWVDEERVEPQPGGFYGGWITARIVGPFKGEPGTWGW